MGAWPYVLLAVVAGAMIPFQAGVNATLARWVGAALPSSLISFAVGTLALLVLTLALFRSWPPATKLVEAPWWVWVGGLLGAFYVFGSIVTAPRLGAVTLVAAVLAGQALASVLIDHRGWVGFEEHPINAGRIIGLLLLAAGVALVRLY